MSLWSGWRHSLGRRWGRRSAQPVPERLLLFVCGGNTCRSAMAEAFARAELAAAAMSGWRALSAGTRAAPEAPIRREAGAALRELGIRAGRHRAQALTRDLVQRADVVFCMTAAQLDKVCAMVPEATSKVVRLDPISDLPDPIGQSVAGYLRCARQIRHLVRQRIGELRAFSAAGPAERAVPAPRTEWAGTGIACGLFLDLDHRQN